MRERSITRRVLMIQEEYGIFDNEEGNLVEFRYDLPEELKKIDHLMEKYDGKEFLDYTKRSRYDE